MGLQFLGHSVDGRHAGNAAGDAIRPSDKICIDPRIRAVMMAARFYGKELDPADFRRARGETAPSAASLKAWARDGGLWACVARLRWRQLVRLGDTGPVVLLFADGGAGILAGADPAQGIVLLKNPLAPPEAAPVAVDELRLTSIWAGDVLLLRGRAGDAEA
jgi:ATP-binding cassette subfamily B protein